MNNQEKRICQNCKSEFIIEPEDFNFYEKIKVPPPTFCPECRFIRRAVFRNERALYKRKCDLCGEEKILIYPKESNYKVYCYNCFFGDNWDGINYARKIDFSRPFFEQYLELYNNVPRLGIIQQGFNVNSIYTNRASDNKNCYLVFASNKNENCFYGVSYWNSKDSIDCYNLRKSERCFECIDCYNCNNLRYSKECNSCLDSWFLFNCNNCQNCFGCINLRNKNYCIFNKQYSREEYLKKIQEFKTSKRTVVNDLTEKIKKEINKYFFPALVESHSTNVSGNWIQNSKNTFLSFNCDNVENGKYLFGVSDGKDLMDLTYWSNSSELIYESINVGRQCSRVLFSDECWDQLMDAEYCINCFSSNNLFGCVGLRKKSYCIFNKQYSKEEYEVLVPKIKEHMMNMPFLDRKGKTYKYGEFFPCNLAPFAYNETIAQEYFPKTKEEAIAIGYCWKDDDKKEYVPTVASDKIPEDLAEVDDSILKETIACAHNEKCNEQCTKAFKITLDELQMYRLHNVPIPNLCPNCRHYQRLANRQPIKLWHRKCMNKGCENEFETSYAPDRPEIVYCKKCYQQEVY